MSQSVKSQPNSKEGSLKAKEVYSISNFDLSRHHCETAVIKCVDFRFRKEDQDFVADRGWPEADLLCWPGGASALADGQVMADQIVSTIRQVCCQLHQVKRVVILSHWDCGAYKQAYRFASDQEQEEILQRDLMKAKRLLKSQLPQLEVVLSYSKWVSGRLKYFILDEVEDGV